MEDNINDIEYYNALEVKPYVGAIILVITFMVLGIAGNVHVLYVYFFRMKATSHRIFILVLAMLDLLSCAVSMPFIIVDMFYRLTFTSATACRILRFFLYFFAGSSGILLLPIAVDRYLKTCRPFGKQITPRRAKYLCASILLIGVFSFWPAPVLYGHNTMATRNPNITGVSCYLDDAFKETLFLAYWNGFMTVMISAVLVVLIILYYKIGKSIRKHAELQHKLLNKCQRDKVQRKCEVRPHRLKDTRAFMKNNGNNRLNIRRIVLDLFETDNASSEIGFGTVTESNIDTTEMETIEADKTQTVTIDIANINVTNQVKDTKDGQSSDLRANNDTGEYHFSYKEINEQYMDKSESETEETPDPEPLYTHEKNPNPETIGNIGNEPTSGGKEITRKHQKTLRHMQRSKRTSQMFFAITIFYLITFMPHLILQLITVTQDNFIASLPFAGQTVYHIVFYCSFLNSMINCYIYGFFDTTFRNELKRIFTRNCIVCAK